MKKQCKGFTLIELLAVIVILAIIALIATPIVLGLINKARKGAAQDSAYGVRKEAQLVYSTALIEYPNSFDKIEVGFNNGNITTSYYETSTSSAIVDNIKFELDGTVPTEGKVTIYGTGKIEYEILKINDYYCCIPEAGNVACEKTNNFSDTKTCKLSNGTSSDDNNPTPSVGYKPVITGPTTGEKHLGYVYINPTDLSVKCTESNTQIGNGLRKASGCMKFYIYGETDDKYKLILDHNSSHGLAYRVEETGTDRKSVFDVLASDTKDWVGNPRLISVDEVAEITGTASKGWSSANATFSDWFCLDTGEKLESNVGCSREQGTSNYAWLTDYTYSCKSYGCNNDDSYDSAYWTSTLVKPSTNSYDTAWVVSGAGRIDGDYYVDNYSSAGLRPVIEIDKNLLSTTPYVYTPVESQTHRYSVASTGYDPSDSTTITAVQPTSSPVYLKYALTNGQIVDGTVPEVCMYTATYGRELCLTNNDYEKSVEKIKEFYGYDANTWLYVGTKVWNLDNSITCYLEDSYISCSDNDVGVIAYNNGIVNMAENSSSFNCKVDMNNISTCDNSTTSFYAVGDINNSSTTRYSDIMDLPNLGKNFFIKYEDILGTQDKKYSLCIHIDGKADCFYNSNYVNESSKLTQFFDGITDGRCSSVNNNNSNGTSCTVIGAQWGCTMYEDGNFGCGGSFGSCSLSPYSVSCNY